MKLLRIFTEDAGVSVAVEHELGRLERILERAAGINGSQEHTAIVTRMVDAFNACEGLSDISLRQLATNTTTAGGLAERVVAMSLLYAHNQRLANRFIEEARKHIAKMGGKV